MSVTALPLVRRRFHGPDDLIDALGIRFSDQQVAAITAPLEPAVIIAGAGSGKTTVMAARVVWLVGTGQVRPEEVLGLTFTRKAAAELSGRVRDALQRAGVIADRGPDESGEQLIMTYDAFAARLVAEHGLRIGVETDPTMISGATRYRLAARVVAAAAGPFDYLSRLRPATIAERVLKLDADLQQHLVDPAVLDRHTREHVVALESAPTNNRGNVYVDIKRAVVAAQERLELASLVQDYQALKQRLGLVEFADQMAIAARLAVLPAVSAALRDAFRVVLLDEYQDTSAAQAIMLHGLFSGHTPSEGLGHPVTAVGDPFQAIYGWRGAAASNILQFAGQFRTDAGRPASAYALTVNRRSGPTILDVANSLSASLRTAGVGAAQLPGLGLLQAPAGTDPATVRGATFATWPEEVSWVADQVLAARRDGRAPRWAEIAVLTRRNADIGPLYGELTARDVPVEIVGLGGLLSLPEVMDVTATLRIVDDVTANPDLIRILTGPRWRIGPRDLALLGRRGRELAHQGSASGFDDAPAELSIEQALEDAVADVDPTDVVSLLDALENPGELDYSAAARDRFAQLAAELAHLRRHAGEPVLDLCRRVITLIGLDVELVATPDFARTNRRDQLGAFLDAVADYVDVDGDASLGGLLAYLQAEIDTGTGLDQVVPSDREAVKLLTVHRAKGLEWDVVLLPALVTGVFPSERVSDNWVSTPAALPADLRGDADAIPQLADATNGALVDYKRQLSEQQLLAEDRLAYVAATRARQLLVVSGHTWRADLTRPRVDSSYLRIALAEAERQGEVAAVAPPAGSENPLVAAALPVAWPAPLDPDALELRNAAAAAVTAAAERYAATGRYDDDNGAELLLDTAEVVAGWDADIERLLAEAREARTGLVQVGLPESLSASALLRLHADPEAFTAELARPMPRPPSRAARFGTRFHAWVERYFGTALSTTAPGQQPLIDPDDRDDAADAQDGPRDAEDGDLRALADRFVAGQYGDRVPYALEAPFSLVVDGRIVRGRIDAVYALDEGPYAFQVVDWKTGRAAASDPLQLAIYRQAWAEVSGVPPEQVDAVFYDVRRDEVVRPAELADRPAIAALLSGQPVP